MTERLIFVNENDQPVGAGPREEAWANGYHTRNVRILIRDENGRILSQKRSKTKKAFPGMWTGGAGGHVDDGESWETAALRETKEEVGVVPRLKKIGDFTFSHDEGEKKIRQIVQVYEGIVDSHTEFNLDPEEVEETKWFELSELQKLMDSHPDDFTPGFKETIRLFYSNSQ